MFQYVCPHFIVNMVATNSYRNLCVILFSASHGQLSVYLAFPIIVHQNVIVLCSLSILVCVLVPWLSIRVLKARLLFNSAYYLQTYINHITLHCSKPLQFLRYFNKPQSFPYKWIKQWLPSVTIDKAKLQNFSFTQILVPKESLDRTDCKAIKLKKCNS